MRIALLQTRLDPTSHAANTQCLAQAIDRAAVTAPAPDLLVLPGGCDAGGVGPGRGHNHFHVAGIRETLSWKAREWGLFVVAGLHMRHADGWMPTAALFDPDGDMVAISSGARQTVQDERTAEGVPVWRSSVGTIGVFTWAPSDDSECRVVGPEEGFILATPIIQSAPSKGRKGTTAQGTVRDQNVRVEGKVFWAFVCPAGAERGPRSRPAVVTCVLDPNGEPVVTATGNDEETICVEIPVELAKEAP